MCVIAPAAVATAILAACVGDEPSAAPVTVASDGGPPIEAAPPADAADASAPVDAAVVMVKSVAAGNGFGCAVLSDATVMCWGRNDLGQTGQPALGDLQCGTLPCRPPTRVPNLKSVAAVATGGSSACAVTTTGDLYCWGENQPGPLGHAAASDSACPGGFRCSPTPTLVSGVSGVSGVSEIAVGATAACAIDTAHKVKCWGSNVVGQAGRGTHETDNEAPMGVPAFDTLGAKHIAASSSSPGHFCAIKSDLTLWCWGRNSTNELGFDKSLSPACNLSLDAGDRCEPTPKQINQAAAVPFAGVDSVAAAAGATCVSLVGGAVWCWGYNGYAVSAVPSPRSNTAPAMANSASNGGVPGGLSAVAGSYSNVCALGAGGASKCWGINRYGELGVSPAATPDSGCADDQPCSFPSQSVVPALRAVQLTANQHASYAVTPEGKLYAWGANASGALGHPPTAAENNLQCPTPCSPTPVEIAVP